MKLDKLQDALENTDRDAPLTVGVTDVVIELRDPVTGESMFIDSFDVRADFEPYRARIILTPQKFEAAIAACPNCEPCNHESWEGWGTCRQCVDCQAYLGPEYPHG